MKHSLILIFSAGLLAWGSCKNDVAGPVYQYEIFIQSPDGSDRHLGDTLALDIGFASQTGETVHHIKVSLFQVGSQAEVYVKPDEPHVHTQGTYTFRDKVILTPDHGFAPGEWLLKAKVWGELDGEEESVDSVHFQILN